MLKMISGAMQRANTDLMVPRLKTSLSPTVFPRLHTACPLLWARADTSRALDSSGENGLPVKSAELWIVLCDLVCLNIRSLNGGAVLGHCGTFSKEVSYWVGPVSTLLLVVPIFISPSIKPSFLHLLFLDPLRCEYPQCPNSCSC